MNDSGRSICAFQDQKYLFAQRCQGAVKVLELRRASAIVEHSSNLTIGSSVAKVGVSDGIDSGTVPVSVDFRAAVGLVGSNDGHESHEGEEDCDEQGRHGDDGMLAGRSKGGVQRVILRILMLEFSTWTYPNAMIKRRWIGERWRMWRIVMERKNCIWSS
jgi:hypothetical protein